MKHKHGKKRWQPCKSRCELAGAASFFLSLRRCAVLFNGPRWCASIAEREMVRNDKAYEKRLFCSEVKEMDLLYGAEDSLTKAIEEIGREYAPERIAVINSCSSSLIGDDIQGICGRADLACEITALDAGGLQGEFWEGYQAALAGTLEHLFAKKGAAVGKRRADRVNLIGICNNYPNWQGDLREIKRILSICGIEVGVCLGADFTSPEDLEEIPLAAANIVMYPELGAKAARRLKEIWGQEYIVAPLPYGLRATVEWAGQIGAFLGVKVKRKPLEEECLLHQEKIDQAVFQMKSIYKHVDFGDIYLAVPYGNAYGMARALQREFPAFDRLYLRVEGPSGPDYPPILGAEPWEGDKKAAEGDEEAFLLVLGNWQTRLAVGGYRRAIFKNLSMPLEGVAVAERPYAGILGWKFFMAEIIEAFAARAYLKERNGETE